MLKFTFLAMKRAVQIADIADFGNDGDAQARTFIAVTAARSVVMVPAGRC
jgi:hypothetical protein